MANCQVVSVTRKTVVPELTVRSPWSPVILDRDLFAVTPGSDTVRIVGRVTLHKLGLNLNSRLFQLARERWARPVSVDENPCCLFSRRVALSIAVFQHRRDVEREPDGAVEQLLTGGLETFVAPEDRLGARTEISDRRLEGATTNGFM